MTESEDSGAKTGRPSSYTPEVGELICSLLAEGQSLTRICKLEGMPTISTVMNWLAKGAKDEEPFKTFLGHYACAREAQAEYYASEIIDIADDQTQDELFNDEGKRICNSEFIARSKLRVDARKWVASKLLPKKYGEKLDLSGSLNVTNQPLPEEDDALLEEYTGGHSLPRPKKPRDNRPK